MNSKHKLDSSKFINSSIKHQTFAYTKLNNLTVLFQTIQFGMSFVCTQFKCQTILFDP